MNHFSPKLRIALTAISALALMTSVCDRQLWVNRDIPDLPPSFAISRDGHQIAYADQEGQLTLVDPATKKHHRLHLLPTNVIASPVFAPDGKSLVFASRAKPNGAFHIYAYDLRARSLRRLTSPTFSDTLPIFAEDGKTLVFARSQPNDGLVGPTAQLLYQIVPGVQTFYSLNTVTGVTRQLSCETFRDVSCPAVYGSHLFLSAWNGNGTPTHFYEIDLNSGASDKLDIAHFDRTVFPHEGIRRGLMILPNKQSPRMQELNLGEDGTAWIDDGIRIDKAGAFGVQATWDPVDPSQIYFLVRDVDSRLNMYFLWRTDSAGRTFERIL